MKRNHQPAPAADDRRNDDSTEKRDARFIRWMIVVAILGLAFNLLKLINRVLEQMTPQ